MAVEELIKLTSEEELRRIAVETFINRNSSVTKISNESVLAGILSGSAKINKKALKDMHLSVSRMFPSTASTTSLDRAGEEFGTGDRFTASQSSVYIKFIADPATAYVAGTHTVSGSNGIIFDLEENLTIGTKGFGYVKARSQDAGISTEIDPFSINTVTPIPVGHTAVTNEYKSTGGRDLETDDAYSVRIRKGGNLFAEGTIAKYTQAFMKVNENVLRVIYQGVDATGKIKLAVLSQNGIDFTANELSAMLTGSAKFFAWTDLNPTNTSVYGISLVNPTYQTIDVTMRLSLLSGYTLVEVIKDIQTQFSKEVDFRFWRMGIDKVEWDNLLAIVKNTRGVDYVSDTNFTPRVDILIDKDKLPRFQGFQVNDLEGNLLLDQVALDGVDPIYYPNNINEELDAVIL